MMPSTRPTGASSLRNVIVWLLMTVILVVVPDTLERWLPLRVAA